MKTEKTMSLIHKIISVFFAVIFILSAFMAASFGYIQNNQHRSDYLSADYRDYAVYLEKCEIDAQGNNTTLPVSDARFVLYRVYSDNSRVQHGNTVYTTDIKGKLMVEDLLPGNYIFAETDPTYAFDFDRDDEKKPREYPFTVEEPSEQDVIHVLAYNRRRTTNLSLTKTVKNADGSVLTDEQKNKEFIFTITLPGDTAKYSYTVDGTVVGKIKSGDTIKLKHNQTAVIKGLPVGAAYSISETHEEGYTTQSNNSSGTLTREGMLCEFINTYEETKPGTGSLIIEKLVVGSSGDIEMKFSFTVTIGNDTQIIKLKHGQRCRIDNIPVGTPFNVVEDDYSELDYSGSIQGGSGTIVSGENKVIQTNTYTGMEYVKISGKKIWDMSADPKTAIPNSITVYLKNGNLTVAEKKVSEADEWKYEFTVPKYSANGSKINYTVDEAEIKNFIKVVQGTTITNKYVKPETASVHVKKVWKGDDPNRPSSMQVQLYKNGMAYGDPVTLSKANNWQHEWRELEKGPVYTVDELNVPSGYTKEITGNITDGFTITNSYKDMQETVRISGSKQWNHGANPTASRPQSITVILRDQYGIVTQKQVGESEHWSWTFVADQYDADGNEYIYSIDELPVPGYTKHIHGYDITNNHESFEEFTIKGQKYWDHGSNKDKRPESITVYLKNGEAVVAQRTVTAADCWRYSFTVPKFDKNGKEIIYTIDEANMPYYTVTKSGYDLFNKFKDFEYPGDSPETGDNSNMILWFTLMIVSLISFIVTAVIGRRRKRKQ